MKIAKKMLEKMITNSSLGSHEACSYEKKADPTFFFKKKKKKKRISGLWEASMIPFESYSKVQKQSPRGVP